MLVKCPFKLEVYNIEEIDFTKSQKKRNKRRNEKKRKRKRKR